LLPQQKAAKRGFFAFMPYTYIIFSESLNRFYTGSTRDSVDVRLCKHNNRHSGFTAGATDWVVVFSEYFDNYVDARAREFQIKAWKSRRSIIQLIEKTRNG